jgi:outer membrane immunogenic protein
MLTVGQRARRAVLEGTGDVVFRPLLLAGMVVGAVGGAASAADIGGPPASPDYVVPTPYYDWTGLYIGGNIGGAWEYHNGATTTDLVSGKSFAEPIHDRFWGVAGGAQLGFNWFVLPSYLVGTEADFTALTNKHSDSLTDSTGTATQAEHPEMLSTIRLRVGLTADRFLWYGTGGVAWVDDRFTRTQVSGAANGATAGTVETVNYTGIGYAVGTGLEYAMMSHVTARVEFLYVGLGTETYTFPLAHRTTSATFDTIGLVRFGLNYRFGGGDAQVPIRARD